MALLALTLTLDLTLILTLTLTRARTLTRTLTLTRGPCWPVRAALRRVAPRFQFEHDLLLLGCTAARVQGLGCFHFSHGCRYGYNWWCSGAHLVIIVSRLVWQGVSVGDDHQACKASGLLAFRERSFLAADVLDGPQSRLCLVWTVTDLKAGFLQAIDSAKFACQPREWSSRE